MFSLNTRSSDRFTMLQQIETYLSVLPDYDRWRDFFDSSVGKTILDLLTGISELLIYKLEIRSRDSYLPTAISSSATYLLAQMLGYNPNRKLHGEGVVTFEFNTIPSMTTVIPAGFVIDYDTPLVVKEDFQIFESTNTADVTVLQGEWKTKIFSVSENNLSGIEWEVLILDEPDFTIDHFNLFVKLDGVELDIVDKIELVTDNSVIARTDYRGGVLLLFGDGFFGKRLTLSSQVEVTYLKTLGVEGYLEPGRDLGSYLLDSYIVSVSTRTAIQGGSSEDSIDKVKYLASRFFQAQGRAVTAYDYVAILFSYPGIVSAVAERNDDLCCTVKISCLKEQYLPWSELDIENILDYIDTYKMLSTQVEFIHPEPIVLDLDVRLIVPYLESTSNLAQQVIDYIESEYCHKLTGKFYSTQVIDDLADMLPGVIRVYLDNVNADDTYPDLDLEFHQYFVPNLIQVTIKTK